MAASSFAIFSLAFVLMAFGTSGDLPPFYYLMFAFFGFLFTGFLYSSMMDAQRGTFEITDVGAWCRVGDKLVEIPWRPGVTADVWTHPWVANDTHGPLAVLMFYDDENGIRIDLGHPRVLSELENPTDWRGLLDHRMNPP